MGPEKCLFEIAGANDQLKARTHILRGGLERQRPPDGWELQEVPSFPAVARPPTRSLGMSRWRIALYVYMLKLHL